jgi:hypothetical protein
MSGARLHAGPSLERGVEPSALPTRVQTPWLKSTKKRKEFFFFFEENMGSAAEDEKIEAFIGVTQSNRMAGTCVRRFGPYKDELCSS